MVHKLQKVLNELTAWGKSVGLSFNEKKTVVIHFTRTKQTPKHYLKMNNKNIEYSKTCTYLGLTIYSKLAWREHIDNKIMKCERFLMKTVNETRANCGPKPKLMKWGFTGMVSPVLTYGSMIWGHAINTKTCKDKLRRLNRLACNTLV